MKKNLFLMLIVILGHGLLSAYSQEIKSAYTARKIRMDFNTEKGPHIKAFKECVGAGRANEGLRADWQQQLKLVQDEIGFRYIRFHGLLSDDMGIYREGADGNPQYNFQYVDVLFDYLLSINLKPFVEFGFMPSALASGKQLMFWWEGNVTPPKSYAKWADLIRHLVMHWEQRYGRAEVKTWYFEIWNEPDLPSKPAGETSLVLSGLPSGTYYLQLYQTGYSVNDAYHTYYRLNSPGQLTREQVRLIKDENDGRPVHTEICRIVNGEFYKTVTVRENDVFLLKFDRIQDP
jgi:beta-xylosidase